MKHVAFKATLEQWAWIESQGRNVSEVMRGLIAAKMPGGEEFEAPAPPAKADRRSKAIRFLEAVAEEYHFHRACEAAQVCPDEMQALLDADENFRAAKAEAESRYQDDIEHMVIRAAKGQLKIDKTAMFGLVAWLNNNHPNWGRIKTEFLQRAFAPLFQQLLKAVKRKVPPAVYKELCDEFDQIREARFLSFSD